MTTEQKLNAELTALRAKYSNELGLMIHKNNELTRELERMRAEIFGEPVLHASEDMEIESSGHVNNN